MKKKLLSCFLVLILLLSSNIPIMAAENAESEPEILIAYFSWSGHTAQLAQEIHAQAGGDLFEIQPETPYTDNINELSGIALQELRNNARPPLCTHVPDMDKYDVVFVGYPCWWSNMPMPVFTFLEEYQFTGKTIIPFTTYGENVFGNSITSMQEILTDVTIEEGLAIQEHAMQDMPEKVTAWLQELGIGNDTGADNGSDGETETKPNNGSNGETETKPDNGFNGETETKPDTGSNGEAETDSGNGSDKGNNTDSSVDISRVAKVTLSKTVYVYNGKKKKPDVTVKEGSKNLRKNVDYTVSYKNNTKVGTASVVISGTRKYTGKLTTTFTIVPKGTSISGKVTAKKQGFTVKWKKQSKATTGYQIQYSTSRKFTEKKTMTKTVKNSAITKLNVKNLKEFQKYYVKIRSYKTVKQKKYYSNWSMMKSVTTKK